MDFFSRNSPVYKSAIGRSRAYVQRVASTGLSGLLGSLFGRSTPAYKTVDGSSAKAPVSSGMWSMLVPAPSYKTAPETAVASAGAEALLEADAGDACDAGADAAEVRLLGPDEIIVL